MKKIYLSIITIILAANTFAQFGALQNSSFENWTTSTLYEHLTEWVDGNEVDFRGVPTVIKSTDAQLDTYSVELTAVEVGSAPDTSFGFVAHGTIGQMGPDGGIPYTSNFDEVRFQYKSDLPVGDTIYLLYMRFALGTQVDFGLIPAIYGTTGTWTQGSVNVSTLPQDELFIGFVVGNPFGGPTPTPGAWGRIDNFELYNLGTATTNVPDPSFENWSDVDVELADDWYSLNPMLAGDGLENANKTTDANSGTYAVEMTTVVNGNSDTIPSLISVGPIEGWGWTQNAPYNASPTTFSGAYKYTGANGDQGGIWVSFYEAGAMIGGHYENINDAATYQTFSGAITLTGTPDSIQVAAHSGNNPGSIMFVDDIQLSGGNVGLAEFANMNVSIYPNPASNEVMIKAEGVYSYSLIDMLGSVIISNNSVSGIQTFNVQNIQSGTYFVNVNNGSTVEVHKLIVQ